MPAIATAQLKATGSMVDFIGSSLTDSIDGAVHDGQSPFRALLTLMTARVSGLVGMQGPEETIAMRLQAGQVLQTASDRESDDEALLKHLVDEGLMTSQDLGPVVEHCEQTGQRLSRTLHSRGLVPPSELLRILREVHTARLFRAMSYPSAWMVYGPGTIIGQAAPAEVAPLDLRPTLARFMRDALLRQYHRDLEPLMAPVMWRWVRVAPQTQDVVDAIRLSKRERHAVDSTLTGEHQLADVMRVSILSKNESARLLLLLFAFGAVECLAAQIGGDDESDQHRIEELASRMVRLDHFTRLEAHWAAHANDISEGYQAVRQRYGPGGRYAADERTAASAARITEMADESWGVVGDKQRRLEYRKGLVEKAQLKHSAELLSAQAETADFRSDRRGAQRLREIVAELWPELPFEKAAEQHLRARRQEGT